MSVGILVQAQHVWKLGNKKRKLGSEEAEEGLCSIDMGECRV